MRIEEMTEADLEFFFDPVCPFCWVTSRWVANVARRRALEVIWRPLSLRILNEPIGYETRPAGYPAAHQRGLEMVRVVAAAREARGPAVVGNLYTAMGEAIWGVPPPPEPTFEAVLKETGRPRDLRAVLARAGLPPELASAAHDERRDAALRAETQEAVDRAGGGVGTPILSFDPPDGPAFFGRSSMTCQRMMRRCGCGTRSRPWPAGRGSPNSNAACGRFPTPI